eukprot:7838245-Pyramimonas_sp.AAC.1
MQESRRDTPEGNRQGEETQDGIVSDPAHAARQVGKALESQCHRGSGLPVQSSPGHPGISQEE